MDCHYLGMSASPVPQQGIPPLQGSSPSLPPLPHILWIVIIEARCLPRQFPRQGIPPLHKQFCILDGLFPSQTKERRKPPDYYMTSTVLQV